MSNPCAYCPKLTIESLVYPARQNGRPRLANYKHHDSFDDLEDAAFAGCDLCRLALECFLQRNLYDKAKNLKRSDVKLWIEPPHAKALSLLQRPEVLNTIIFRVGETSVKDPDGSAETIGGFIVVKRNIQVAGQAKLHRYPPVIDVGTLPVDAQNDQVRIFCSQGTRSKYVALSHCWGGKIEPALETGNLDRFQNSIPYSSLPATFRDAVTITRNLGIQYLWIDSLCIIQDSRDDWVQESNNMGPIFRDSTLALFATASKSSNEGIFNKGSPVSHPKDAQLKVFSDPEDYTTVMASVKCLSPKETFSCVWSRSPLAARGWTFQEQVLAPRCLIYGERGIFWKCPQDLRASKLSDVHLSDWFDRTKVIDPIIHSPTLPCDPRLSLGLSQVIEEYYKLVSAYSQRTLTFSSDKLPAMSAIAKALSHKLAQENASPTYLAGLWEMDLPPGLIWEAMSLYAPHVSTYREPSWSWATTDSPITFVGKRDWSTDLRVVSCEVCPLSPGYPFGEVKSGRLVVEGRTIPLIRSRQVVQTDDFESELVGWCKYDECLDGEDRYHSRPRIYLSMKGKQRCLLTFNENTGDPSGFISRRGELEIDKASYREEEYKALLISIVNTVPQEPRKEKMIKGILLQRRPESEEYERIGSLSVLTITCTWLDSIQQERLVMV